MEVEVNIEVLTCIETIEELLNRGCVLKMGGIGYYFYESDTGKRYREGTTVYVVPDRIAINYIH